VYDFMNITKALADENRVRILMALQPQELCVCQIIALLELAPSTVSKHMSILKYARLVESRKDSRWIYYRLPEPHGSTSAQALAWLQKSLKESPKIMADRQKLTEILRFDQEELCRCRDKNLNRRKRRELRGNSG